MANGTATGNSTTTVGFVPIWNDVNNRRFLQSVLAGVIGGAGISAAANLLRHYVELRGEKKDETNDDTIVLNLPRKMAADGYEGMRAAKPGETKITANGGQQFREGGKYGKGTGEKKKDEKPSVKCAVGPVTPWDSGSDDASVGPNSVATMVFSTLGLTTGGLLAYDAVSRLFDRWNERRLKRKLEAAQQAYVGALTGASKRAEMITKITDPVEHALCKEGQVRPSRATELFNWLYDKLPVGAQRAGQYPTAFYILALLASTGATAYVTKKVMDREFPEEKLKKDINKPTRVVFRTEGGMPQILEGEKGQEKQASDATCAALAAMLPIYQDVVEGVPNRTLTEPYVKLAEELGTDAKGLMKEAAVDYMKLLWKLLQNPRALWSLLTKTRFGLDLSKRRAAEILRTSHPDVYKELIGTAIDDHFNQPGVGAWAKRQFAQAVNGLGYGDWMVRHHMAGSSNGEIARDAASKVWNKTIGGITGFFGSHPQSSSGQANPATPAPNQEVKSGEDTTLLHSNYLGDVIFGNKADDDATRTTSDEKDVLAKVRKALKGRRGVRVEAADPNAAKYIKSNKAAIKKLLARLNASGAL